MLPVVATCSGKPAQQADPHLMQLHGVLVCAVLRDQRLLQLQLHALLLLRTNKAGQPWGQEGGRDEQPVPQSFAWCTRVTLGGHVVKLLSS
eukprot:1048196-Pelagomonas_calceolata.AAC.17